MPRRLKTSQIVTTAARWPVGIALTSWRYLWRTTPIHRWEMAGTPESDSGPPLPDRIALDEIQRPEDGAGPLLHRLYRTRIDSPRFGARELMDQMTSDLDQVAPTEFASFQKAHGETGQMAVADEYVVRMPGPWDGPVRVIDRTPTSFRLATLDGHLEAGQIEFRVTAEHRALEFVIESWARSGDPFSDLLYSHLRLSKEIQLHMWTSTLERIVGLSGGTMKGGISVTTKRVERNSLDDESGLGPEGSRARQRLEALAAKDVNFDPPDDPTPADGWHVDDLTERLPPEPPGPPVEGGSFEVVRELMIAYQVADPDVVRATYAHDAPLERRDMLLQIRFAGLRMHMGVRVGEVYDETREVDGDEARVFGWGYSTLEGHFEEGTIHYEAWKWLESGDVEFRVHAFSRAAHTGPPLKRLGFRLFGRRQQLGFYREVCRRMRRLTEAELELRRHT